MKQVDVIIIGGGLAGLTAAIHLSKLEIKVLLFEKEEFPHHKVCGEYLSNEVIPYFNFLNIKIDRLKPVSIQELTYSSRNGKNLKSTLPLGGLGISRFALDNLLAEKARENAVPIKQETVSNVKFYEDFFEVKTTSNATYYSKLVLGAFGKRSNLDKFFNRNFINRKSGWLAVKSHYQNQDFPNNRVELHNFKGGYCGLSKVENGNVNVCYLTTYKSFKPYKNPEKFQEEVLFRNKNLKSFFENSVSVFEKPLTIAQISFKQKSTEENNVLMLGDAAGLIHPLCGNGMAMAIHSAKIASEIISKYLQKQNLNFLDLKKEYDHEWKKAFQKRLMYGKFLQEIMLRNTLASATHSVLNAAPFLLPQIIKRTHGNPIK